MLRTQDNSMIAKVLKMYQPYQFTKNQFLNLFQGKELTVIYIPEAPKTGENFVNTYRKKGIFNEVLIPLFFLFQNRRLNMQNYIREFRKINPNIKIVTKFKSKIKNKINLIDLTGLVELFYITLKFKAKFKLLINFFDYINEILKENNCIDSYNNYIIYEGTHENYLIIDLLYKLATRKGMKLDKIININGLIAYKEDGDYFKLYPILTQSKENADKFEFKFQVYKKYIEDLTGENITEENEEEKIENTKKEINDLIEKLSKDSQFEKIVKEAEKSTGVSELLNSEAQLIDQLYNKISQLNPDRSFEENLEDFLEQSDFKTKKKIKKIIKYIQTINEKYNGVIHINEDLIKKTSNLYYNPVKIVGLESVNIYNKTATEFDSVLDNAMFDLIKSIEKYKDAHLKVLGIETEIIDTNKSRFKEYRVKVKATDRPDEKAYTLTFRVPYPVKGKYLKLDGNTYIMINQFYPKPILKVKPNVVRLYTHYSTLSVELKNHKISEQQGLEGIFKEVSRLIKSEISWNTDQDIELIKEKFDLPEISVVKFETK
jgi:hypothetical protein